MDKEYKFSSALLSYKGYKTIDYYNADFSEQSKEISLSGSKIQYDGTYKDQLTLDYNLEYMNVLKLHTLRFCSGENCVDSPLTVEYKFFSSSDESASPEETPEETPVETPESEEPISV